MIDRLTVSAALIAGFAGFSTMAIAADSPRTSVGERIFAFVDSNGDKSIDTKEFGAFSASIKSWLIKHGFDGSKPISQAAFVTISGRMMSDLRRQPSRIGVPAPSETGPGNTAVVSPAKSTPAKVGEAPLTIEQTVAPGTAELPLEFQAGDLDRDGQISFFEWRSFKRTEMSRFYQLDANKDYVLSVAELGATPATALPATGAAAGTDTTPATGTKSTSPAVTPKSTGPSQQRLDDLKYIVEALDKNKNQLIEPDEWSISKTIKPAFEKAKIDITKPMKLADFSTHYNKLFPE